MTDTLFSFDGTAGTAITNTNKAAINASIVSPSGGTQALTAKASAHGTTGLQFTTSAAGQNNISRFAAAAANAKMGFAGVFFYQGAAQGTALTGTLRIGQLMNASGLYPLQLKVSTANQPAFADRAGGAIAIASGQTLPTFVQGTQYFIQGLVDQAAGSVTIEVYDATGTTMLSRWTKASGADLGTDLISGAELGNCASAYPVSDIGWDDFRLIDGATTMPGPYSPGANQAPTAAYAATRVTIAAAGVDTATLSGTDPDGTIASYEHAIDYASVAGSVLGGATSQQATLTVPNAPGNVVRLKGRVKDNAGAYSPYVYREICIPTSDQTVYPMPDATGGFSRFGSATTDGAALADTDDTTGLETPAAVSATAQTCRARVRPMVTRSGTLAVFVRLWKVGTGSCTATVALVDGSNASRGTLAAIALTETPTDYELDLTASQVDAITATTTAWNVLYVDVTFTG